MYEIFSTVICSFGCITNITLFCYLFLRQRKGLTNKLFTLLTFWDLASCVIVTVRIWAPKNKPLKGIYVAALYNNCFITLLIATTRAIKICMPFYRIRRRLFWSFPALMFLYSATITQVLSYKGEIYIGTITLNLWQIAFMSTDMFWIIVFMSTIVVSNVLSARKLLRPGPIPVTASNAKAAKTVIIISVIFLVSNSVMGLHFYRNINYAIRKSTAVKMIKGWNVDLGTFAFRFQLLLNSLCNPIVYFIRNRSVRTWVTGRFSNSLKFPKFIQITQILSKSGVEPTSSK